MLIRKPSRLVCATARARVCKPARLRMRNIQASFAYVGGKALSKPRCHVQDGGDVMERRVRINQASM